MTGRRYTRDEIARALDLIDEGTTYAATVAETGINKRTLMDWRRKRDADPTLSWAPERTILPDVTHGTTLGYWRGCACVECLSARSEQSYQYKKERILGAPGRIVPSVGARRRVRALMALGWSAEAIGAAGGTTRKGVAHVFAYDRITRRKHDTICRAYDELSMSLGPSLVVRGMARNRGYAPPLAWDDDTIDDPDAQPNYGEYRFGYAGRKLPDVEILVAEVNRSGVKVVAQRYLAHPTTVGQALNRAGYRAVMNGATRTNLPTYIKREAAA